MSTVIGRLLQIFVALFIVLVLFLAWASQSNSGLTWLLKQAPASVQAEGVRGVLGDFSFASLTVGLPDAEITLHDGQIQWNVFDLLTATLAINQLHVQSAAVRLVNAESREVTPSRTLWQGVDLPVNIIVRDASLTNLRIRQANEVLTELQDMAVRGAVHNNLLHLEQLSVGETRFNDAAEPKPASSSTQLGLVLRGALDLSAQADGRVQIEFAALWPKAAQDTSERLTLAGAITGQWQSLSFETTVSDPVIASLNGHINGLLTEYIRWQISASSTAAAPDFKLSMPMGTLRGLNLRGGELTLDGGYSPAAGLRSLATQLVGSFALTDAQEALWKAELDVGLEQGALQIRTLNLVNAVSTTKVNAAVAAAEAGRIQAAGTIDDVFALLNEWVSEPSGSRPTQSRSAGLSRVNLNGEWSNLSWASLAEELTELDAASGQFSLTGEVGDLNLSFTSRALWRGNNLSADAQLRGGVDDLHIDTLQLEVGGASITAQGRIADTIAVDVTIDAPKLSSLHADAGGDLAAQLRFTGPREHVQLVAEFESSQAQWRAYKAEDLRLNAQWPSVVLANMFDLTPVELAALPLQFDMSVGEVRDRSGRIAKATRISAKGTLAEHNMELHVDLPRGATVVGRAQASVANHAWSTTVSVLDIKTRRDGVWTLSQQPNISIATNSATMPSACLANKDQRVCIRLDWDESQQEVVTVIREFELHNLQRYFQLYDLSAQGRFNGVLRYSRMDDAYGLFNARIMSEGAELTWQNLESEAAGSQTVLIDSINLIAEQKETLKVSAELRLAAGGQADFNATFGAPFESADFGRAALLGRGRFNLPDLAQLPPSILNDISLTGELSGQLDLAGQVDAPSVSLSADMTGGSARVPDLGLFFQDIELQARSSDSEQIDVRGSLRSGAGQLQLSGALRVPGTKSPSLALRITGDDLEMANTPEMQIFGDVALDVMVDTSLVSLLGAVTIDSAELDFKIPETAVQPSNDVVLAGVDSASTLAQRQLDVRVDLGDQTRFQAQGLDAQLLGQLRVLQQPNGIMRGEGQISLSEGRYVAYGQNLDIDSGVLIFDGGSIDDPNLDLKAQRVVEDTTVGVRVTGRAQAPRLALFSTPTMPDQDILAVLIFKKPVDSLASNDALTLLRIANSVTGDGPDQVSKLTQRLQDTLGLTELELNLADGEPGLVARKQLTSRFSLAYGYGLLDAAQSLFLRYRLSDRWSIKAEIGSDSGADLRYQIER